ncbi:nucleotidyltransferase domain-containing protein [bacterium]|nr:nucleotidyltransferase domain-containing protein [bacterium]
MISLESIRELSDRIAQEYHPDRIVLFGSYAYGHPTDLSDVDMLVVMPFEGGGFRKSMEILRRFDPPFDVDIIARKPDDTARRYAEGDPLIREALDRGTVLYERNG